MNKEDECQIVEDLLYAFNEEILNKGSSEFVNEHLKECERCRDKLETIRSDLFMEKKEEEKEEKIELTHLLKINKVMRILKYSLVILITVIVLFLGSVFFRNQECKNLVDKAYSKIEELEQCNNYKIRKRVKYISHSDGDTEDTITEIYYKDGIYKEVIPDSIFFYKDNDDRVTYVFEKLKTIEHNYNRIIPYKGYTFKEITGIRGIYENEKSIFQRAKYEKRDDIFNDIECYVLTKRKKNNEYYELWVDKENFITIRTIENDEKYYREITYDIDINETLDSDVTLNAADYTGYQVKDLTKN